MRIPKYWAQVKCSLRAASGRNIEVPLYGWSDISVSDAEAFARKRAERIGAVDPRNSAHGWYGYNDRPIREPVLDDYSNQESKVVITRTRYGAKVMNTSHVAFVDIDVYQNKNFSGGIGCGRPTWWDRLLKRPDPMEVKREGLKNWFERRRDIGMRLYETPNGFRGIITHNLLSPTDPSTEALLTELGCDPLYVKLCKSQQCFRARLTAKPWRIGAPVLSACYPYTFHGSAEDDSGLAAKYDSKAASFAACKYIAQFGVGLIDQEVQRVIAKHDELSGALSGKSLA